MGDGLFEMVLQDKQGCRCGVISKELLTLIVESATASLEGSAACLFLADERQISLCTNH